MKLLSILTLAAALGSSFVQSAMGQTGSVIGSPEGNAQPAPRRGGLQAGDSLRATAAPGTQEAVRPRATPRFKTPYERIVQPRLNEMLKQVGANGAASRRAGPYSQGLVQKQATANAASGTPTNFPKFAAAPFQSVTPASDSTRLYTSVTGDFNNDGKPDLVAVQARGTITTFLNPGSFKDFSNVTPLPANSKLYAQIPNIAGLQVADMDGDGNLDLVGQDSGNGQIVVWLGHGDGTFADAATYLLQPTSGANWFFGGSMLVGDINGDGKPDVVAVMIGINYTTPYTTSVTLQTYLNKGDGTLAQPTTETDALFQDFYTQNPQQASLVSGSGGKIAGVTFLLQADGIYVPAKKGANLFYVASHGDGTFTTPIEPDSAAISEQAQQGSGSVINISPPAAVSSVIATNLSVPAKSVATSATTDVVFLTGDGAVYHTVFTPGTTSAVLPPPTTLVGSNINAAPEQATGLNATIPNANLMNLADVNNDGSLDLIVYTYGSVLIFPSTGKGTYGPPSQLVGGLGGDQEPAPADFEGNGYLSFFWADSYLNEIGYYQNLGASAPGQFYGATPASGISSSGSGYTALASNVIVQDAGDFNGDGLLDVIAYDFTNTTVNGLPDVVAGFNNGKPNSSNQSNSFTFKTVLSASALQSMDAFFVQPLTLHQGASSSFIVVTGYGLQVVTADASGTFGAPIPLSLGLSLDCALNYGDAGDINGDGAQDIVIAYGGDASCEGLGSTPSGYFTFLGTGTGGFQPATFTPLGSSLYMVKLINFTGAPGNLDLAADDLAQGVNFSIYTIPNKADGSGTFDSDYLTHHADGYFVTDIIPGDYNQDGKQDLTLTTEGQQYNPQSYKPIPDTTGVLLLPSQGVSQGYILFGNATLVDNGLYPSSGSYGDFNGDGYPDLVVSAIETIAGLDYPFSFPPPVPLVQILTNQHGVLGAAVTQFDSAEEVQSSGTFVGNFGNTGGNDLLITSNNNSAVYLNQGANSLALTASAVTPAQGAPVTFTATTSQPVSGYTATGSVDFSENGTSLGSGEIVNNAATFTTSSLSAGAHTITANYSGDNFHNASSASVLVTVAPAAPMFTLTAATQNLVLQQGATGTLTLNLLANGTFSGAVSFSCSGAPSEASCTVNPASVTLGANQSGVVSVVLASTAKNNTFQAVNTSGTSNMPTGAKLAGLSLAGLLLLVLPKKRRRLPNLLAMMGLTALSLGSFAMLSGCSGGGDKYPGTPVGNSTLTITATSGTITQTQTIALSITQAQQ